MMLRKFTFNSFKLNVVSLEMILLILICIATVSRVRGAADPQDYQVYGKINQFKVPLNEREIQTINSNCFSGIGFITCVPNYQDDNAAYQNNLYYYNHMTEIVGSKFCLQCCGGSEDNIDFWDLECPFDISSRSLLNLYGYEFRMARRKSLTDKGVIICPLRRSFCSYDDDGQLLGCDLNSQTFIDNQYLVGATVTFTLQQWSENGALWNGISKCSAIAYESPNQPADQDIFYQKIIMIHPPVDPPLNLLNGLFYLFFILIGIHFLLKYCRKKVCIICHNRLIYSFEICMMCKFVGAQPPDHVLLAALEDKGVMIQGVPPESFPGLAAASNYMNKSRSACSSLLSSMMSCLKYVANRLLNRPTVVYSEASTADATSASSTVDKSGQNIIGIDQGEMKDVEMSIPSLQSIKTGKKVKEKLKRPQHLEKYDFEFIREAIEHTDDSVARIKADIFKKRELEKQKKREKLERIKYEKKHHNHFEDDEFKTLDDIDSHLQILSLEKGQTIKL